ncbi:TetR family transcriptional regulator [Lentzea sp. NBRC 105346]|uniref:TetR/AcrR family transcriptional regulator n=1 Tax=Lentzea sp. NBRC 105346 TaxID=3032205 RepID=UPI002552E649|nr:TetR/AcrR family transcriptional regulator [Lentzea sp. NBRC 105346]GLZ33829.1 TetR family transcriptional regulator [Lentzea sp. NBRC 105346]
MPTTTPRDRYREQVRTEAKSIAWEQIGASGASGLSLNAIAKQMGVSGPALYRYFAGRDELMTELISDAYTDIAAALRAAAVREKDDRKRPAAVANGLRTWAKRNPHRYLLVWGTPVPGYEAPQTTTDAARKAMAVLLETFAALDVAKGRDALQDDALSGEWAPGTSPRTRRRALAFWTRVHGFVSLEICGHFNGMGFDPDALFAAEVGTLHEV